MTGLPPTDDEIRDFISVVINLTSAAINNIGFVAAVDIAREATRNLPVEEAGQWYAHFVIGCARVVKEMAREPVAKLFSTESFSEEKHRRFVDLVVGSFMLALTSSIYRTDGRLEVVLDAAKLCRFPDGSNMYPVVKKNLGLWCSGDRDLEYLSEVLKVEELCFLIIKMNRECSREEDAIKVVGDMRGGRISPKLQVAVARLYTKLTSNPA